MQLMLGMTRKILCVSSSLTLSCLCLSKEADALMPQQLGGRADVTMQLVVWGGRNHKYVPAQSIYARGKPGPLETDQLSCGPKSTLRGTSHFTAENGH